MYIGEIWRFRISLKNLSNYSLRNFGLLVNVEMVLKGSTQLYPRPHELCPSTLAKGATIDVDLEYPVTGYLLCFGH